jgi:hypothetical protein
MIGKSKVLEALVKERGCTERRLLFEREMTTIPAGAVLYYQLNEGVKR